MESTPVDTRTENISVCAISSVDIVGWFPDNERQVWVEITIGDIKVVRRLVLPNCRPERNCLVLLAPGLKTQVGLLNYRYTGDTKRQLASTPRRRRGTSMKSEACTGLQFRIGCAKNLC